MSKTVNFLLDWVDTISDRTGRLFSHLVFVIMIVTTVDVVARYVFNHPLLWGWLLNRQLFGVFILFAGVFTLAKGDHIRIEIFYEHFSPAKKTAARWVALACLIVFLGVLIWQGSWMGWNSLKMGEKAAGAFRIPLYPFKILIPTVAFLFLLEGISVFRRNRD